MLHRRTYIRKSASFAVPGIDGIFNRPDLLPREARFNASLRFSHEFSMRHTQKREWIQTFRKNRATRLH